jgi:hypothetical protein
MKYLIFAENTQKFQTNFGWVKSESELMNGEKMVSFNSRDEADKRVNKGMKCCCSWGIHPTDKLYKHC